MSDLDTIKQVSDEKLKDKITVAELAIEVKKLKEIVSEIIDKLITRNF